MTEPTLADAERMIARAQAARGTCRDRCDIISYEVVLTVVNGTAPDLPNLREELAEVVARRLGPEWFHAPNHSGYLRRCDRCRETPLFPWAINLNPEKVLAFMKPRAAANCTFYLGELETTL